MLRPLRPAASSRRVAIISSSQPARAACASSWSSPRASDRYPPASSWRVTARSRDRDSRARRLMIAPARIAAYNILRSITAGDADLPTAIADSRANLEDDRDRALAADIATGVQRWRAALDHLIVTFAKRRLERLDP